MIKVDQLFKNRQKPYVDVEPSGTGGSQKKRPSPVKFLGILILLLFILSAAANSFYVLTEDQTAVITTFGRPSTVTTSGLHFKVPFVQNVHTLTKSIMGMAIGYAPEYENGENPSSLLSESEMITKDFNFVNVDFYIEYQIIDPIRAYINSENNTEILKNLAQSYIRDTVGTYDVDEVITTGKAEIQAKVKTLLSERLEREDIGIGIYNVTIQDAEPPTTEVSNAFKSVEDAKQGMDTAINQARKYQSEQLPAANATADKKRQDAEAYRQQRISEAEGQASRFNDIYAEYIKYPLITKKRMFYEAIEDVLPSLKVIINGSDGTQTVLPLDSFVTGMQNAGEPAAAAAGSSSGSSAGGKSEPVAGAGANESPSDSSTQGGARE